jgi:hypothetical protein
LAWQDVRDADMIRRIKRTAAAMKCAFRIEVLLFAMRKMMMLFLVLFLPEWESLFCCICRDASIYIHIPSQVQMRGV